MKHPLLIAALCTVFAGCASTGTTSSAPVKKDYTQLVADAENEIKLASQTGFLWSKTEDFVKEARSSLDEGASIKLLNKAIKEAQLAQQQAKDQANPYVVLDNMQ